jgi:PAS domain-containing protein
MHAVLMALERTYQAALDDSAWTDALAGMTKVLDAPCGMVVDAETPTMLLASVGMDREAVTLLSHELSHNCPTWIRTLPEGVPTRQTARISDVEFARSELYQHCIRKVDGFYGMLVPLPQRERRPRYFVAGRLLGQPDFDADDVRLAAYMAPHLQAALAVRSRLDIVSVQTHCIYDALAHVHVGVILLDARLRPVFVNARAEALAGDGLLISRDKISASHPHEVERLHAAIASTTLLGNAQRPGPTCYLTRQPPRAPLQVTPVRFDAAVAGGPSAARLLLLVTEGQGMHGQDMRTWAQYRFTQRETALADHLASGASLAAAADSL